MHRKVWRQYNPITNQTASVRGVQRLADSPSPGAALPLPRAPCWGAESRGHSGQGDSVCQQKWGAGVGPSCQNGRQDTLSSVMSSAPGGAESKAGKAQSRRGRHPCRVVSRGFMAAEAGSPVSAGRGEGKVEGGEETVHTDPPLSVCQIPAHLYSSGKDGGRGESGLECRCLRIFGSPSVWLCQFQHVHLRLAVDSVFYRHPNQIFYWVDAEQSLSGPPQGIGCVPVIRLVLSCQAGTSLATKARLFHDPDTTAGSGGALGNPSLCSA